MPVNPIAVMSLVNGFNGFSAGGLPSLIGGIASSLNALSGSSYAANHIYSPTDNSWNSQQLIANANSISGTQGTALASYQQLQAHAATLQALRDRLMTAVDPKDVEDAQAEFSWRVCGPPTSKRHWPPCKSPLDPGLGSAATPARSGGQRGRRIPAASWAVRRKSCSLSSCPPRLR